MRETAHLAAVVVIALRLDFVFFNEHFCLFFGYIGYDQPSTICPIMATISCLSGLICLSFHSFLNHCDLVMRI
jgi:hypothetical protein